MVIWTLLSQIGPLTGCPFICTCNITHSDCSSRDLLLSVNLVINRLPPNITTLNLSRNNITMVDPGTFTNLSSLMHMDLSHNQLLTLYPSTFSQLSSLEVLDLSNNLLETLPFDLFSELVGLRKLILKHNRLKEVRPKQFQNFADLQHLDLSFNRLVSLDPGVLNAVQGLKWLSLAGNKLKMLERSLLEPLVVLQDLLLDGNQWNCSCSLTPFRYWLEWMLYRGGQIDTMTCSFPAILQGHDLRYVPSEMFRHCSQLPIPNHRSPRFSCVDRDEERPGSAVSAATCPEKRPNAASLRRAPTTMVLARLVCGVVWLMMVAAALYGCIYATLASANQRELLEGRLQLQQQPLMKEEESELQHDGEEVEKIMLDFQQTVETPEHTEWMGLPPEVCV